MKRWMRVLMMLIGKELRLEARGKELSILLLCSSIMTSVLVGAGVSGAMLSGDTLTRIFPTLLWVVFLLSTTASSVRGNEHELEGRGFEGLLLCGVSGAQMYVAKVLVWSLVYFSNWIVLSGVMAVVMNQEVLALSGALLTVGCMASLTLASLVVLTATIASSASLKGAILPLVTLPLLFPVFFSGVELTTEVLLRGSLDLGSIWSGILLVSFTLFVLVGINTYQLVISE